MGDEKPEDAKEEKPVTKYDDKGRRLVDLPSGRKVRIVRGTGKTLKRAHLLAGKKADALDVVVALISLKTEFTDESGEGDWTAYVFEDLWEVLEDVDMAIMQNEAQKPMGKPSQPST